jgi:chromate transporter
VTLWVTFVPCFIWIFAGAPLIDWLEQQPRLTAALQGITAAVVGVIANLSLWFAIHVFFDDISQVDTGIIQTIVPNLTSFQPLSCALAALAAVLLFWRHMNLLVVLAVSVTLSGIIALL